MQRKSPETQFRREIHEFNREFLELLCGDCHSGAAFGLALPVRQRLRGLTPGQLEAIAETPCLLAAFAVLPPRTASRGVADAPVQVVRAAQADAARLFATSLLVWLWHTARQDRLLAALCIGPGRLGVDHLSSVGFRDLQRTATNSVDSLEARFCRHPRLWPDLVRGASAADAQVRMATRLSVVQLTLISRE
jgi:hypothetical protein